MHKQRQLQVGYELADGLQNPGDGLVAGGELTLQTQFQRVETLGESLVPGERLVLGEAKRHRRGKFETLEVVAICDHLIAPGAAEMEGTIVGKARIME